MIDEEERLHVKDFDPLTKKEFIKLMGDTAEALEEPFSFDFAHRTNNINKLRELARRVQDSGEVYRKDPKEFFTEHTKSIAIWKGNNIPKINRDVLEGCLCAISRLAAPTTEEIEMRLISKRWKWLATSNSELRMLIEKRDSYLFIMDLLTPLWDTLCEIEERRLENK